jgi:2-oxoglutarate/2-oxoacid ferredoxin oxidoreductase subunit alpha
MKKANPKGVLTGTHFIDGDHACCEGALAAGCRFIAGYPITPSTEVVERFAARIPLVGGVFIQMEDEIASSIAIQGAVWAGAKAMTVTSGPGFSLMMEHIGLACMLETPCVFINVQRGGPSTGLPTLPGQADMMQVRWGSHGDYQIIALSPNSPQECFDLTIQAFNLAETYRVPAFVMMDECVGHMMEKVVIPPAEEIEIVPRTFTKQPPETFLPYKPVDGTMVPEMVKAGKGYRFHVTGLTHDEKGYPVMNWIAQDKLVRRLVDKIKLNADKITKCEENYTDDAEIIIVSYGITSRIALKAVEELRQAGIKVGLLRLIVAWPFPEKRIAELSRAGKKFIVVEMNLGQMYNEVQRFSCNGDVRLVSHAGGTVIDPEVIIKTVKEVLQ